MALRVRHEVTSEHPCQIPVLGVFEAGETKEVTPEQLYLFEQNMGYKLAAARFAPSITFTVHLEEVPDEITDGEPTIVEAEGTKEV